MSIGNWYRVGTVAVTNGSVNVVGTGTFWTSQCNPGDRFTVDGQNWYEINTITDDTHMALLSVGGSGAFAGATAANLSYAIDRNFTNNLNANIAASVASLVAQYQANSNGPLSGLFGNGVAATPGIAFLNEASTGLFHPAAGIAALAVQGAEFLRAVGTAAGVPAMLGLGQTAPANALDILTVNNALYGARIQNSSAGAAARAALQIGNTSAAAQVLNLGVNSAGFTASGVLAPSRGFVEAPNGVDFASGVTAGTAFSWGVGAGYASKMAMDYLGDVAIGGTPLTVAGYTTLTLNNATTGGILDLQTNGVDVGRLTGGTAALNLAAIGASVPLTFTVNGSERGRFGPAGQFGIGMTPTNVLDITQTQNASSVLSVLNASAGVSAQAVVTLNNGTNALTVGQTGGSFTPSGVFKASQSYLSGNGAGGLLLTTGAATPVVIGINNAEVARFDTSGRFGVGATPSGWSSSTSSIDVGAYMGLWSYTPGIGGHLTANSYFNGGSWIAKTTGAASYYSQTTGIHSWTTAASVAAGATLNPVVIMTLDGAGSLLVGTTSSGGYRFRVSNGTDVVGTALASFTGSTQSPLSIFSADAAGQSGATTALSVSKVAGNGRSANLAGTLNATGADYAEYRKLIAALYGLIAKGGLLGYDAAGLMTNVFADVVGRVLPKSTAPSYVGNDTWGTEENICAAYGVAAPGAQASVVHEPIAPIVVADPGEGATEEKAAAYAAYLAAVAIYPELVEAYSEYQTAEAAYQTRLTAFNAALETERAKWDRIALCGVVPVNVAGLTSADIGKHLVPCAASDGTITATAVAKADLTLMQYIDSFGTIEMIGADGRPLVNVKNG
ncbi:MAG: hypothetical protein JWO51_2434 [Rhodospirillales bacterium]|nr:hypothetical protein [Rhodospirillales bacterium]